MPDDDACTVIATRWCPEFSANSQPRKQTKKPLYDRTNILAGQLNCKAAKMIANFKGTFPGVASWLHEAVLLCVSQ